MLEEVVVIIWVEERLVSIWTVLCWSFRNEDWFHGTQGIISSHFLRNPQNTFPMLKATVQMESSRSFGQAIMTTYLNIVETLVYLVYL